MRKRISVDILIWCISAVICILWRLAASKAEIWMYLALFGVMMLLWIGVGCLLRLYRPYRETWLWQSLVSLALTTVVLLLLAYFVLPALPYQLSSTVAMWMVGIVAVIDMVVIFVEHYWKYATNMTVPSMVIEQRDNAQTARHLAAQRSEESIQAIKRSICSITTVEDYDMLREKAQLDSTQTKVVADHNRFAFLQIPDYEYATLVDLLLLNDAKGINRRFCIVNLKLPDNGRYVCCYRPQEYIKQKIYARYPKWWSRLVYFFYFFWKRVIPRLLFTSRLYYDVTKGRKRMLSKTEVIGRLYYCGFRVDETVSMGNVEYIFAHRHSQPYPQEQIKVYGPLIKLRRVGKGKEYIYIYKFRTMHPYAEYIQQYVFDQRGGMNIADKSDNDWRITTWGRIMRKYWLDELPMLINWLRGDVKLVGVRPLSKTMFDTYPVELQDKRTRCKPGLIPPFYIDHPQTFDELFASEEKYLDAYFKHPLLTDIQYFFRTLYSILFRRVHSA